MLAIQAYDFVNDLIENSTYTGQNVVDPSSLVAFAEDLKTNPALRESVYNTLYARIGKTVSAIDLAPDVNARNVLTDEYTFGCILQKISFALQEAESASEWDIANPQNPYEVVRKEGIVPKYFHRNINAFAWTDVIYDRQLFEAFISAMNVEAFTSALMIRMENAKRVSEQSLVDIAIATLIASLYADATAATPGVNSGRRVRHLLTEYNKKYGTSLTADTALQTANYLDFIRIQIELDRLAMDKYTKLYNDGSVERRSTVDDINLDMSANVVEAYKKFYGDTFNEKYVQLPYTYEVENWGIATDKTSIAVKLNDVNYNLHNIIALQYDRDACVCTLQHERSVSIADAWNERTVTKVEAERSFIVDLSEQAIVYFND